MWKARWSPHMFQHWCKGVLKCSRNAFKRIQYLQYLMDPFFYQQSMLFLMSCVFAGLLRLYRKCFILSEILFEKVGKFCSNNIWSTENVSLGISWKYFPQNFPINQWKRIHTYIMKNLNLYKCETVW